VLEVAASGGVPEPYARFCEWTSVNTPSTHSGE
jgi:hypothetical protein